MAPTPKHQSRRRRSKPTAKLSYVPAAKPPELTGDHHPRTVEWWDRLWRSPVGANYIPEVDVGALSRLARLYDQVYEGSHVRASTLGEIRAIEDRFGLNPLSRRRLGWDTRPITPDSEPPEPQDERFLRVVTPDIFLD